MTTYLFDVMLEMQHRLGEGRRGQADSGSTTTLVDNELTEGDDYWNGGTLFFVSGVTALDNSSVVVTDFTASSDTLLVPTRAAAITSAVVYEVYTQRFDRQAMIRAVNQALSQIDIPAWDDTIVVTANTLRYALPAGVSRVARVWVHPTVGGKIDPYTEHRYWREEGDNLEFYRYEPTDTTLKIRLEYPSHNIALTTDGGVIDRAINLDRLVEEAIVNLLMHRLYMVGTDEPNTVELLKQHQGMLAILRNKYPQLVNGATKYSADW